LLANTHIKAGSGPHSGWQLLREGFPDRPELGPSVSRVLLEQVADGERPATVRLSRPGRVVAFGRRDVVAPGYRDAVEAAERAGFPGMERLSGGRAAAFSEGALSLTFTLPDPQPAKRTNLRFTEATGLVRDAFRDLGVDARMGEVPDEYCPGEFSINARGRTKLAGVGQRMIGGAAHIGLVIIVSGSELVADVLEPVYSSLDLDFNRDTVGSLEDEVPGIDREAVEDALLRRLAGTVEIETVRLDQATLDLAASRAADFRSNPAPAIG
jgi:lipoate-protein ligase A